MTTLPLWQSTFRNAIAPLLTTRQLDELQVALATDDPRLLQGITTDPPAILPCKNLGCTGACLLSYPFALDLGGFAPFSEHPATVEEVETAFARICFEIDQKLGEPAGCRFFLNPYDDWTREEMRHNMLTEILRELARRLAGETTDGGEETSTERMSRM